MLPAIVVGFLMATLGVALLFLGEVPFVSGRRIPTLRSRLIGGVMVAFLPVAFAVQQAINLVFGRNSADGPTVTWLLFSVCWAVIAIILFPVLVLKREARKPAEERSDTMMFGDEELTPKPVKTPAAGQPVKKAPAKKPTPEDNPFDFS